MVKLGLVKLELEVVAMVKLLVVVEDGASVSLGKLPPSSALDEGEGSPPAPLGLHDPFAPLPTHSSLGPVKGGIQASDTKGGRIDIPQQDPPRHRISSSRAQPIGGPLQLSPTGQHPGPSQTNPSSQQPPNGKRKGG